jgi:cation diffusion facilitator family transporter
MLKFIRNIPRIEAGAAIASLVAAVCLLLLKFVAYYLTNSSAIFSDALETIANVAAALMALYSLYMAHRPADEDHPYGHGKVEFLSAGFEGSMILTAALVAVLRSADALLHKADVHFEGVGMGLGLMVIALVVNGVLGVSLVRIGQRVDSITLKADGQHLLSDAVSSITAICGLIVVRLTRWNYADPIAALFVAAYLAFTGAKLLRGAVGGLMDQQDAKDEKLLQSILDSHVGRAGREPWICSYHKLRHRHSGRYHWVDFHIMVPGDWDIRRGHDIASAIEYEIEQALGSGNATAHVEPCDAGKCAGCSVESEMRGSHESARIDTNLHE